MKIGSVRSPQTAQVPYSRARPSTAGAGVAQALGNLGGALSGAAQGALDIEAQYTEHERRKQKQRYDLEFIRKQGEWTRQLDQAQREAPAGAPDFTNQIHDNLRQQTEAFISNVDDEELKQFYREKTEELIQNATTAAFTFEFEEGNRAFGEEVVSLLDDARLRVREDPEMLQQELETFSSLIEESTLTAAQKAELTGQVLSTLQQTEYLRQVELAQENNTPVGPANGSDVVAPGVPAPYRALLNVTAGVESPGYNVIYGGERFSDFSDHPRNYQKITSGPNAGKRSSAAGRYQFLADTWDFVVEEMKKEGYDFGPEEFSPVNQDRAAMWYARYRYNNAARRAGAPQEWRDLDLILATGDREGIKYVRQILSGDQSNRKEVVWEGLQNLTDDEFANMLLGRARQGGTDDSPMPDAFGERYDALDYDTRVSLDLQGKKSAEERRAAQAEAARQREEELYDQLLRSIEGNEPSAFASVQAALDSNSIQTRKFRADLNKKTAEQAEMQQQALTYSRAAQAGTSLLPEEAEAGANAFNRISGITDGLREGDVKAAEDLVAMFGRTEALPTEAVELLQNQLRSSDPNKQRFAATTLGGLYDQSPEIFAAQAGEAAAREAAWINTSLRYGKDLNELIERRNTLNQPGNSKIRKELSDRADELLVDMDAKDTLNKVTSWWERNLPEWLTGMPRPNLPAQAEQNLTFQQDYQTLFRENLILLGGDEDAAHDLTGATMSYSWAVDPLNGNLMKYSPMALGTLVPRLGGDYSWIEPAVREATGLSEEPVSLIFDKQTEQEVMSGQTPSYLILTEIPFGDTDQMVPDFARDEDGNVLRVPMEPTQQSLDRFAFQVKKAQLQGEIESLKREIEKKKTQTLRLFLAPRQSSPPPNDRTILPRPDATRNVYRIPDDLQKELDKTRKRLETLITERGEQVRKEQPYATRDVNQIPVDSSGLLYNELLQRSLE